MTAVIGVVSAAVLDSTARADRTSLPKSKLSMRSLPLPASTFEAVVITRQPSKSDPPVPTAQLLQELVEAGALEPQLVGGASGLRRTSTAPSSRTSSSAGSSTEQNQNNHPVREYPPADAAIKREAAANQKQRANTDNAADEPVEQRSHVSDPLQNGASTSTTNTADCDRPSQARSRQAHDSAVPALTAEIAALKPPTSPRMHQAVLFGAQTRPPGSRGPSDVGQKHFGPRSTRQRQPSFNQTSHTYGPRSPNPPHADLANWPSSGSALGISNFGHLRGMSPDSAPSPYQQYSVSPSRISSPSAYPGQPPFGVDSAQQFAMPGSPVSSQAFFSATPSSPYRSPTTATSSDFATSSFGFDSSSDHIPDGFAPRHSPPYAAQGLTAPYMAYTHFTALDAVSPQYGQQYIQFATGPQQPFHVPFQPQETMHFAMQSHAGRPTGHGSQMAHVHAMSSPPQAYHALGFQAVVPGYGMAPLAVGMPVPGSPSTIPPPQVYAPPPELARGHLAQARFHDAVYGDSKRGTQGAGRGSSLPKPPAHSPYALWVGNVPSDATHAELWAFFNTRSPPSANPKYAERPDEVDKDVDLGSVGIDSIHVINRSNCAFVNYKSSIHLRHAIEVCNGVPLRMDPRCKDLVCRERKKDEDTKSGVGAQRIGGMHREFVREKRRRDAQIVVMDGDDQEVLQGVEGQRADDDADKVHALRHSTSDTLRSVSTASTSSSFLRKHFEKRYFILKSHDENDLNLSVERGIWATQAHNEPVLDQAYRTAKDVYLIFGANARGAFFGVARMASPIHADDSSSSSKATMSSRSDESLPPTHSNSFSRPATITEEMASSRESTLLFPEAEDRFTDMSPLPVPESPAPTARPSGMVSAPPPTVDASTQDFAQASTAETLPATLAVASNLKLPDKPSKSEPVARGQSLDPSLLVKKEQAPKSASDGALGVKAVELQQLVGASGHDGQIDGDGVWRKDTLPTPAERNARLGQIEDRTEKPHSGNMSEGWGKPFRVEWIKVARLPFSRTRHIRNQFNAGREVKISRDGTELEPSAGESLINAFFEADQTSPTASPGMDSTASPLVV
ncbi:hypothetical protein ACM66B_006750 [Microbotryomycetes sp. NB124-2]